jgi:threonine dehydrogenase-like Zn-dependent dehydrogenase
MYQAGDVRVENVPDPVLREQTDAIVRVISACICGSDLWPYQSMPFKEQGRRMGHEFIGIVEEVGRAYIEELMPDILDGTVEPGRVFDRTIGLDEVPDGYKAMAERESLKVLIQP